MSARPVIKTSTMAPDMQEAAIQVAQDAIRDNNLEKEIANAVKAAFEGLYPSLLSAEATACLIVPAFERRLANGVLVTNVALETGFSYESSTERDIVTLFPCVVVACKMIFYLIPKHVHHSLVVGTCDGLAHWMPNKVTSEDLEQWVVKGSQYHRKA